MAADSSGYSLLLEEQKKLQLREFESKKVRNKAARLLKNEITYLETKDDYIKRNIYYDQRIRLIKDHLQMNHSEALFDWDSNSWEDIRIRKLLNSWLDIVHRNEIIKAQRELLKACFFTGLTEIESSALLKSTWYDDSIIDILMNIKPDNLLNRKKLVQRMLQEWSGSGLDIHLLNQFHEQVRSIISELELSEAFWLLEVLINEKDLNPEDPFLIEQRVYDYWISLLESYNVRIIINEISREREILQITGRFPELVRIFNKILTSYNQSIRYSSILEKNIIRRSQLISLRVKEEEVPSNQFLMSPYSSEEIILLQELMDILYKGNSSFFRFLIHSSSTDLYTELIEDFLSLSRKDQHNLFEMLDISLMKGRLIHEILLSFYKPELSVHPEWKQLMLKEIQG